MFCSACGAPIEARAPCPACGHTPVDDTGRDTRVDAHHDTLPITDPATAPTMLGAPMESEPRAESIPDTLAAPLSQPSGGAPGKEAALIGRTIAGRFRILSLLGAGGMGSVYLADQLAVDRRVVLKFLQTSLAREEGVKERFAREALAVSKLESPNTIVLHDFGHDEDDRLFIAMEFLEGQTLAELIHAQGALPPLRAIAIVLQILASLEEAHGKGVVHRDLKPENIMLVHRAGTRDFVKVLDFGVAKILAEKEDGPAPMDAAQQRAVAKEHGAALTQQGAIFGSPRYMAPEQAMGAEIDARTDLYAMGVILYELLSGRPPFSAENTFKLLHDHANTKVRPLHVTQPQLALPAALSEVVARCLEKSPDRRPASASTLADELRAASDEVVRSQAEQEAALLQLVGIERRRRPLLKRGLLLSLPLLVGLALGFFLGARGEKLGGVELASGARVFLSASEADAPAWTEICDEPGSRCGRARGLAQRIEALRLAEAAALARLLELPLRFPREELSRHRLDLKRLAEIYAKLGKAKLEAREYWVELAQGGSDGRNSKRYDAYVQLPKLSPLQRIGLKRRFVDLRFDNGSFLLDQAVRARRCEKARKLARDVRYAITEMKVKKVRRRRMEGYLQHQLGPCGEKKATPL